MCYNHVEFYGLRSAYQIVLLSMTESKQEMGSCYTRVCVCVCVCVRACVVVELFPCISSIHWTARVVS
jgi:hypothetical protein